MEFGVQDVVLNTGFGQFIYTSSDFSMEIVPTSTGWPFAYVL